MREDLDMKRLPGNEAAVRAKDGRIAQCMRDNLSGVSATDELCARIRSRAYGENRETGRAEAQTVARESRGEARRARPSTAAHALGRGMPQRRRVSMALAFALMLVLLTATATAAMTAWREYAMRAQQTEKKTGAFASWTLADKLETVAQLAEAGLLEGDERAQALLDAKLSADGLSVEGMSAGEAHAQADAIVAQVLGGRRPDDVGAFELTEAVFGGPFEAWSYEDKAWWQSVADAAGTSGDAFFYTLPREGELTYDEALAKAKETAASEFGLGAQELDAMDVTCDFIGFAFDEGMRVWRFTFGNAAGTGKSGFLVWLHAGTGEIRNVESW